MMNTVVQLLTFTAVLVCIADAATTSASDEKVSCPPLDNDDFTEPYQAYSHKFTDICIAVGFRNIKYGGPPFTWSDAMNNCHNAAGRQRPGMLLETKDALWLLQNTNFAPNRINVTYWVDDFDVRNRGQASYLDLDAFGNITLKSAPYDTKLGRFLCYVLAFNAPCLANGTILDCFYNGKNPHVPDASYKCRSTYCKNGTLRKPPPYFQQAPTDPKTTPTSAASDRGVFLWIGHLLVIALHLMK